MMNREAKLNEYMMGLGLGNGWSLDPCSPFYCGDNTAKLMGVQCRCEQSAEYYHNGFTTLCPIHRDEPSAETSVGELHDFIDYGEPSQFHNIKKIAWEHHGWAIDCVCGNFFTDWCSLLEDAGAQFDRHLMDNQ